jgi:Leucine-rich repeat (LRR) protein
VLTIDSAAITDAGLQHLAELADLQTLHLTDAHISGNGLSYLDKCKQQLKSLDLWWVPLTDEAALPIGALVGLEHLVVDQSGERHGVELIGDSILESCAKLRRLRELTLCSTRVTGAGLRHLRGITTLREIDLSRTQVCGPGLEELSSLPGLTNLDLSQTPISDADLYHVGRLCGLDNLVLRHTSITDAGVAQLSKLNKLTGLDLIGTKISDSGLVHLHAMKALKWIGVGNTNVTKQGIEHLRLALPQAEIIE